MLSLLTHIDTVLIQFYKDYCSLSLLYIMNKKFFFLHKNGPSPLYRYTEHRAPPTGTVESSIFNLIWTRSDGLNLYVFKRPWLTRSKHTRSGSSGVKKQLLLLGAVRKKLPAAEQKPVLSFLFLPTKVMYIHVYNTVSFSANTVINSTYHMQTEPGRKKTDLGWEFQGHTCIFACS